MTNPGKNGVSLRNLNFCLILAASAVSALMIYSTFSLSSSFTALSEAVTKHHSLENDAASLIEASDYLTENVQRYVISGNRRYLENYLTEANETRRREKAVEHMSEITEASKALMKLREALGISKKLMYQEYYAMLLVLSTRPGEPVPDSLSSMTVRAEDQALSVPEKLRLAQSYVFSENYYHQKEQIRNSMSESLAEIHLITDRAEKASAASHFSEISRERWVISIQVLAIMGMILLTSYLGITPVLRAAEKIKSDSPLQESGSNEFRFLARAYNQMFRKNNHRLARLNYKASMDELTGLYNRSACELILSAMDIKSSWLLLITADFPGSEEIPAQENGGEEGATAASLKKVARALINAFRTDDYICRVGSRDFLVFMFNADKTKKLMVNKKAEMIRSQLSDDRDGVPVVPVTISCAHGSDIPDSAALMEPVSRDPNAPRRFSRAGRAFFHKIA